MEAEEPGSMTVRGHSWTVPAEAPEGSPVPVGEAHAGTIVLRPHP